MSDVTIRPAVIGDAATILGLIQQLADYEKRPSDVKASVSDIEQSLFSKGATAHALVCEVAGEIVGYAVYFYNYSTWLGKNGLYLEDLYVSPQCRGQGVGKALIQHVAKIAVANQCGRFEWCVLDWNQPAIDFYRSIGAKAQDEWVIYRLTDDDLLSFANQ
ncbi:N-acetyltransferase family protein [Celerinatantimonas sp. MCCC 1A17872]|uniref:GNAT family N-acetyltransferase n=1 Tax=Celerinatantimonas sp. MCCC 1A17872 TaxID=3177514 RepID=UPI0038CBF207